MGLPDVRPPQLAPWFLMQLRNSQMIDSVQGFIPGFSRIDVLHKDTGSICERKSVWCAMTWDDFQLASCHQGIVGIQEGCPDGKYKDLQASRCH